MNDQAGDGSLGNTGSSVGDMSFGNLYNIRDASNDTMNTVDTYIPDSGDNFTNYNPDSNYDENMSVFASKLTVETKEMAYMKAIFLTTLIVTVLCNLVYWSVAYQPIQDEAFIKLRYKSFAFYFNGIYFNSLQQFFHGIFMIALYFQFKAEEINFKIMLFVRGWVKA